MKTDPRLNDDDLLERIEALERADCCRDGHSFAQAMEKFTHLIFCTRCGELRTLGTTRQMGLSQEEQQ